MLSSHVFLQRCSHLCDERKREAHEPLDASENKKPRLAVDEEEGMGKVVNDTFTQESSYADTINEATGSNIQSKAEDTGGTFRENPYTFLAHSDPILISCMSVTATRTLAVTH